MFAYLKMYNIVSRLENQSSGLFLLFENEPRKCNSFTIITSSYIVRMWRQLQF